MSRAADHPVHPLGRRMRRLGLLALLGVATTVAVAWGCGLLVDPFAGHLHVSRQASSVPGVVWSYAYHHRPGAARVHVGAMAVDSTQRTMPPEIPTPPFSVPVWAADWPSPDPFWWTQDARGWPWLSMWSTHILSGRDAFPELTAHIGDGEYEVSARRGWVVGLRDRPGRVPGIRVLPYGVIWRGFALDTLLFAAVWAAILAAGGRLRAARRRRRIRLERCVRCRYPVGELAACPECGTPA